MCASSGAEVQRCRSINCMTVQGWRIFQNVSEFNQKISRWDEIMPSRKSCGGDKINIYYRTLKLINGHIISSILGKVRNSRITVIWFTIRLNSITFVQWWAFLFDRWQYETLVFDTVQAKQPSPGRTQLTAARVRDVFAHAEDNAQKSLTLCKWS